MNKRNGFAVKVILLLLVGVMLFGILPPKASAAEEEHARCYLSDMTPYSKSIGYGTMKTDTNMSGAQISYIVNGVRTYFKHGITAHATSTVVYDIGAGHPYDYFSTYLGVDASQAGKGEVKFSVYTSADNSTWNTVLSPTIRNSANESIQLTISVSGVRYLKFVFDSNGGNGNDHSGLGNPLLYKANSLHEYDELIKPVEYYDNLFGSKSFTEIMSGNRLEVLQRMLIENAGYDELKESFLTGESETARREMLTWLYNDADALEEFLVGGNPDGSYVNALDVLTKLYQQFKNDMSDTTALYSPESGSMRNRGDLYRTMMFAIALTHADGGPHMWLDGAATSDPVERYNAFKKTYTENLLRNDVFENLNVEEMRYVMGARMHNDEIYWLNNYVRDKTPGGTYPGIYSPHRFLRYGKDWDYTGKGYKIESNFATYDARYSLTKYGLNFSSYNHLWMVFEGSHICWGISYAGTNFANAFGVPAHYNRQPGHAAFFVYNKNANNQTIWGIDNNISGWTQTFLHEDVVGYSHDRVMCNWGNYGGGLSSSNNATYLPLATTALDNYDDYAECELLMSLQSLAESRGTAEELYRKVLGIMPYHLDAWEKLCRLYAANKSETEISGLAEELCADMYAFPLPMHDLLSILRLSLSKKGTDVAKTQIAKINNLETVYLQKGTKASSDAAVKAFVAQPDITVVEANYLLGNSSGALATFSFDGSNGNKIVFGSQYAGVRYRYSLDGGATWSDSAVTASDNLTRALTDIEIANITADNDILIWLEGWTSDLPENAPQADKAFRIDILVGTAPSGFEKNDNENRFLGTVTNLEYSVDNGSSWSALTNDTVFAGEKTVKLRRRAFGTTLMGPEATYTFAADNTTDRAYIKMGRFSYVGCSSEETSTGDNATHAFDGLLSTRWHTLWKGGDSQRYITVQMNEPVMLTGVDYTPTGSNGTCYSVIVWVSPDGTEWYKAGAASGWAGNSSTKKLTFDPVLAKYVKFQGISTSGGFCSARLIEFFEDTGFVGEATGIEITSAASQTQYFVNQSLDTEGLVVSAVYAGGKKARIPDSLITFTAPDFTDVGNGKTVGISYGGFETSYTVDVLGIEECTWYNENKKSGHDTLDDAVDKANAGDVLMLMKDITLESGVTVGKKVTLDGGGHTVTRGSSIKNVPMLSIGDGGDVTLKNITFGGGVTWNGTVHEVLKRGYEYDGFTVSAPIIKLTGSGRLYLNGGTVLKNNFNSGANSTANTAGAVNAFNTSYVEINGAELIDCYCSLFGSAMYIRDSSSCVINDVKIKGCSGNETKNTSVICVDNNSTLTMNGGSITNNYGYNAGGVFWVSNGALTVNGGKIADNVANKGAGIYVSGTANVTIDNFDAMQEIYLTSGKQLNVTSSLSGGYLKLNSDVKTDGTVLVNYSESGIELDELLLALDYTDKMLVGSPANHTVKIDSTSLAAVEHSRSGKKTYYDNFMSAYNVSQTGDKITLQKDVELPEDISVDKAIDIELGNNTFIGEHKLIASDGHDMVIENGILKFSGHSHKYIGVTYVWSADFAECTASGECSCGDDEEEKGTVTPEIVIEQGCETDEIVTYTAVFFNSIFDTQTAENIKTKDKLNHTTESVEYLAPTAETDGHKAYDHCTRCGKNFIEGVEMSWDDIVLDKLGYVNVTFDSHGGSAVTAQKLTTGTKATEPTAPTRSASEFIGWYNGDAKFDFGNAVGTDITLTARWKLGKTDTAVNIGGDKSVHVTGNVSAAVTGLESIAVKMQNDNSGKQTMVVMSLNGVDYNSGNAGMAAVNGAAAADETVTYYDISIAGYLDGASAADPVTETDDIICIEIPFDMTNRKSPTVRRYHESSATDKLTTFVQNDTHADGTFCVSGTGEDAVFKIYSDKFSILGIGTLPDASTMDSARYLASVTLNSSIDINFDIDTLGVSFGKSLLSVTANGNPVTMTYADGKMSGVIASVKPTEIGDVFACEVIYNSVSVKTFNISVADYCKTVLADGTASAQLKDLCKAVLNYGAAAQESFVVPVPAVLINSGNEIDLSTVSLPNAAESGFTANDIITEAEASVKIDSAIALVYTFKSTEPLTVSDFTVKNESGKLVQTERLALVDKQDGIYELTVSNISAGRLSRRYTVSVKGVSITFGVYDYCAIAQTKTDIDGFTDDIKKLCKAIYLYGEAAKTYTASKA